MNKKVGIGLGIVVLLLLIGIWSFNKFGDDTPIVIQIVDQKPESLIGITFRGIPQNEQLSKNFEQMEALRKSNPTTFIHTIYEVEPAGKLDTMIVFVGINTSLNGTNLEVKTFEEHRFLLSKITGSSWVMPSPLSVQKKLRSFAQENNLQLSGIFIDKIISDEEVHIIAPIK
jgi:effector-binding domain-containing protein